MSNLQQERKSVRKRGKVFRRRSIRDGFTPIRLDQGAIIQILHNLVRNSFARILAGPQPQLSKRTLIERHARVQTRKSNCLSVGGETGKIDTNGSVISQKDGKDLLLVLKIKSITLTKQKRQY